MCTKYNLHTTNIPALLGQIRALVLLRTTSGVKRNMCPLFHSQHYMLPHSLSVSFQGSVYCTLVFQSSYAQTVPTHSCWWNKSKHHLKTSKTPNTNGILLVLSCLRQVTCTLVQHSPFLFLKNEINILGKTIQNSGLPVWKQVLNSGLWEWSQKGKRRTVKL